MRCCACFRPQADDLVSLHLQQVRSGKVACRVSSREFVETAIGEQQRPGKYDWLRLAGKLATLFGKGACTFLWYPRLLRQGPGALVRAVFAWRGASPGDEAMRDEVANPSPNAEALHRLRFLNSVGRGGRPYAVELRPDVLAPMLVVAGQTLVGGGLDASRIPVRRHHPPLRSG